MPKEICSDVNFIIAVTNELDELYLPSINILEELNKDYKSYLLLIRAKKHFLDTFTQKIFDAFTLINRSIVKVTTRIRTSDEKVNLLEVRDRVNEEINKAIGNKLANKNFVKMILSEYTITSLLDIRTRKEALEKFQQNEHIADEMLEKFKATVTDSKLKFLDGGPPHLRPANKLVVNKQNQLKELQPKHNLFLDTKNKPDMEDLAIASEYLCHVESSKSRKIDFITSDGPLKKSLLFVKKLFDLSFDILFLDRKKE